MKKFIVSLLIFIPLGLVAQESKFAIVNTGEIMNMMPEIATMENEMAAIRMQYQNEAKAMQDEYERKYADFMAQADSLNDNIRQLRIQEIDGIQERLQNFIPLAQEPIEKKQNELLAPIQEKVLKAIQEVGAENNYTGVLNPQVFLYQGNSIIDATDKVKAKLGLR